MAKITITKNHATQIREDKYGNLEYIYPTNTLEDVLMDQESEEDIRGHVTYYATCDSAVNSKVKEISVIDGKVDIVKRGVTFIVNFPYGSTAAPPVSLSVNGGTPITIDGVMESNVDVGQNLILTYNGSRFIIAGAAGVPITQEEIVGVTPSKTRYLTFVDGVSGSGKFKIDPKMKIDKDGLTMKLTNSTVEFSPEPDTLLTDNRPTHTPASGDTLATLITKLRKILGGLGALAFRSNVGTAQLDTTLSQDYSLTVHKKGTINGAAVNDLYNGTNYGKKADGSIDGNFIGKMALDAVVGVTLQKSIDSLNSKITSFENTKSKIVASALGKARGMATTWTWAQIISNIEGIATKTSGSSSQTTANKWGIDTRNGAWLYIPSNGYYTTNHWLNIPWNTLKTKLGNAEWLHVLSGVTFSSEIGIKQNGGMTNRGAVTHTFTPSGNEQTYTIPAGYHNGNGKVTCKAVSLTGNADAGHVLSGKTFYKNSLTRQTGTMKDNGALNHTFTPTESIQEFTIPKGYHNGNGKVKCNPGMSKVEIISTFKYASYTCQSDSHSSDWYDLHEDAHKQTKYNIHFRPSLGVHRIIYIGYQRADVTGGGYEYYNVDCHGKSIGVSDPNYIDLYNPNVQGSGKGNVYNQEDWATANDIDIYLPAGKSNKPYNIYITYL